MKSRRILILLLMVGSLATWTLAILIPSPALDTLTETSSLIVLGEMTSMEHDVRVDRINVNYRRVSVRIQRATLRIDQLLKGDHPSGSLTFEFHVPDQDLGWDIPIAHAYGLFFFTRDSRGAFQLTEQYHSYVATPRGLVGVGKTPLDRIISLLSSVVTVPLWGMKANAMMYIESSKSDASTVALRGFLSNEDPSIGLNAARALSLRGDGSGLPVIKRAFLPGVRSLPNSLEVTVPNCIGIGLHDAKFIPDLEELLHSTSVPMRRGVAQALIRTKSKAALRGLLAAAADSDSEVRFYGASGLAEIRNNPQR